MIRIKELSEADALYAIEHGDFPKELTGSADRVAVIMTQHWCPDWLFMRFWLNRAERTGQPEDLDIDVHLLVYDQVGFFDSFRHHKESVFGNSLIPYVRYYQDGDLLGDSNQVMIGTFLKRFRR